MSIENTPEQGKKKPTVVAFRRRTVWLGASATAVVFLIFGATIGASGTADSEPAPTATVTAEPMPAVTVAAEPDDSCRVAAVELQSILSSTVNDALIPYTTITTNLIGMLQYGIDQATLDETTTLVGDATSVVDGLTQRTKAITPAYDACVSQ